jgi:hypothetical protein
MLLFLLLFGHPRGAADLTRALAAGPPKPPTLPR